ncbi:MAG TPA: hypothetical protein VHB74_15575 [Devosia sp.]|nr:hypothetical protein [Devosia sp.]
MKRIWAAGIGLILALWSGFAYAAIIGPTDDWRPLRQGARALGISDAMVQRILSAGVEMSCPGTVYRNGGALNGWFLGADTTSFYTNAHGVIDTGSDRRSNFIEPLDKCTVHSYRDLVSRGAGAASYAIDVPQDRTRLALATFQPQGDAPSRDRARLRLSRLIAGARALAVPNLGSVGLAVGQEVILVSVQPPSMREPEIEACHIRSIRLSGGPGQLYSDCDNGFGNSAGLYFVRDPGNPGMLVPVALHEGCYERLGNYKDWSLTDNTAMGILLRGSFFSFPRGAS